MPVYELLALRGVQQMASIRLRDVGHDDDFLGHGVSHTRMDVFARRLDEGRNSLRDGGQRGAHRDERRTTEGSDRDMAPNSSAGHFLGKLV